MYICTIVWNCTRFYLQNIVIFSHARNFKLKNGEISTHTAKKLQQKLNTLNWFIVVQFRAWTFPKPKLLHSNTWTSREGELQFVKKNVELRKKDWRKKLLASCNFQSLKVVRINLIKFDSYEDDE